MENILDTKDYMDPDSVLSKIVLEDNVLPADSNKNMSEGGESGTGDCLPIGKTGGGVDMLPPGSVILNEYELRFEAANTTERLAGICRKSKKEVYVQKAFGSLTLYKIENGGKTEILSVTAISGDGGNGCLPNNEYAPGKTMKYYVGRLEAPTNFHDGIGKQNEKGVWVFKKEHSWKLYIYESFVNRGLFRIHPTPFNNGEPSPNDGCISPYPSENGIAFYNTIKNILTKRNYVIPLYVKVDGNYNITVNVSSYLV